MLDGKSILMHGVVPRHWAWVIILSLAAVGTVCGDALDDAKVVWHMANFNDANGPAFSNFNNAPDSTVGVDVSGDGITAPNADGLAVQNSAFSWSNVDQADDNEVQAPGSVTIFVRHKTPAFVVEEDIWAVQDTSCTFSEDPMYGIHMVSGNPGLKVTGLGNQGASDFVQIGQAMATDTWYDYTGVFDADAQTITIYVSDPVTNEFIGSNSMDVPYTVLEPAVGTAYAWFVSPCVARDTADPGAMMELAAMWDRALTLDEIVELSGGSLALKVTHTDGGTQVAEEGETTDALMIELNDQPTADVTVVVDPPTDDVSLNAEAVNDPITLTFTIGNWNVPQAVTVKANDDAEGEGPETHKLTATASSADEDFNSSTSISVSVVDNDFAGVAISKAAVGVEEGGADDTYTVTLTFPPTDTVVITVSESSGEPNQLTLNGVDAPLQLTFTTANWSTSQTVTVGAIDDGDAEGNPHAATVSHRSFSAGDADYNTLDDVFGIDDVEVSKDENDCDVGAVEGTQTYGAADLNQDCITDLLDVVEFVLEYLSCSIDDCS